MSVRLRTFCLERSPLAVGSGISSMSMVVAVACHAPNGAESSEELWETLLEGRGVVGEVHAVDPHPHLETDWEALEGSAPSLGTACCQCARLRR